MTFGTVCFCRNDNYRGDLDIRFPYSINSMISTSDEVVYVDWGSEGVDLITHLKDKIHQTGKLHVIKVSPAQVRKFTKNDPQVQTCCAVLSNNIGLRRAKSDWMLTTSTDAILPTRKLLEPLLVDSERMVLLSRRDIPVAEMLAFSPLDTDSLQSWAEQNFRRYPAHGLSGAFPGDIWSKIDCCGDFQILSNKVWNLIRGYEERFIYRGFVDSNINKKVMLSGREIDVSFEVPSIHVEHPGFGFGGNGGGVNNIGECLVHAGPTSNLDSWGFADEVFEEFYW